MKIDNLYSNKNTKELDFHSIFGDITCVHLNISNSDVINPKICTYMVIIKQKMLCSKDLGDHPQTYHGMGINLLGFC